MNSSFKFQMRQKRKQLKINQKDLADKLNLSRASIIYYETGKQIPGLENVLKISSFLNINLSEIKEI